MQNRDDETDKQLISDFISAVKADSSIKKQALENADRENDRQLQYQLDTNKRAYEFETKKFSLIKLIIISSIIIVFMFVLFSIYLIYKDNPIGVNLIIGISALLGGLVSGYGLGKNSSNST